MENFEKNNNYEDVSNNEELLEKLHGEFKTSGDFLKKVIEAGNNSWAQNEDPNISNLIAQLGSLHRSTYGKEGASVLEDEDGNITRDQVKHIYQRGLRLAIMVGAIYHGEIKAIGDQGKLLKIEL